MFENERNKTKKVVICKPHSEMNKKMLLKNEDKPREKVQAKNVLNTQHLSDSQYANGNQKANKLF
jgi:hypothetical protein